MAKNDTKKTVCMGCGGPQCRAAGCKGGRVKDAKGVEQPCTHCNGTGTCPSWVA